MSIMNISTCEYNKKEKEKKFFVLLDFEYII
jgi:hypothetical protein